MMSITTLGRLELHSTSARVEHRVPAKAAAALVYLADRGDRVSRTKLAGLLWSDHSEERARGNLRVALSRLRKEVGPRVGSDRDSVWIEGPYTYDVHALNTASPAELLELYRGDFLAGFDEPGCELFEGWLVGRRAALRAEMLERVYGHTEAARREPNWALCRRLAERTVELDPWNEQAHRWLMESLAVTVGPSIARSHFEAFSRALFDELGEEPEPSTVDLADSIRTQPPVAPTTDEPSRHDREPVWPTRLIGRAAELDHLEATVRPGRPVSIVGPGGVGKSRLLAASCARQRAAGRRALWVSFEGHASVARSATPRVFAETVLAALDVPASSEWGPEDSLRRRLGDQSWTLCLDNLEPLEDVERTVTELGTSCPAVEVVLTTRRRLVLVSGSVVELSGLGCNADDDDMPPAVELFLDRLPRSLDTSGELEVANEVCAVLGGLPLAIELAAHWAGTASLAELLKVLESGDALTTRAQDLPTRHRGLDVLVAASVERVSAQARRALRAAAVFSGPFDRADLEALVIVTDRAPSELVEHSLLSVRGDLYQMHPVIRRFVATQLQPIGPSDQVVAGHARRLVEVMRNAEDGPDPGAQVRGRAEDLRRAIAWCVDHMETDQLMAPLRRYLGFLRAWGWFKTGLVTIEAALRRDDLDAVIRAELHRYAAEAMLHAGKVEDAEGQLERGLALLDTPIPDTRGQRRLWNFKQSARWSVASFRPASEGVRAQAAERARLMSLLGELFYVSERRAEMTSYSLGSLAAGRLSREPVLMAAGDAALSVAAQLTGAHRMSARYWKRARRQLQRVGSEDPFTATMTWGVVALVAAGAGRWSQARDDCAASIRSAAASGRTRVINQTEILLALIDYHEGLAEDALRRLSAIEVSIQQNGFRRGLTWVYATRAEVAHSVDDHALARESADLALTAALEHDRAEDAARARIMLARLDLAAERPDRAEVLLRDAASGLEALSAFAIQHLESHHGAARVAVSLEQLRGTTESRATQMLTRFKSYARAFPIAAERYESLRAARSV